MKSQSQPEPPCWHVTCPVSLTLSSPLSLSLWLPTVNCAKFIHMENLPDWNDWSHNYVWEFICCIRSWYCAASVGKCHSLLAQSYSLFRYLPCIIKISSQFYARLGNFTFFRYFSFPFPLSLFPSLALSIASGANFPNLTLCTMKLGVEKVLFSTFCRTITTSRENWDSGLDSGGFCGGGWAGLCKQEMHNEHAAAGGPATPSAAHWLTTALQAMRTLSTTSTPTVTGFHSFLSGFVVNKRFLILIILMPAAAFHLTYFLLRLLLLFVVLCCCYFFFLSRFLYSNFPWHFPCLNISTTSRSSCY